jgi:hypothetical protein
VGKHISGEEDVVLKDVLDLLKTEGEGGSSEHVGQQFEKFL